MPAGTVEPEAGGGGTSVGVILLFVDGFGLGTDDPARNPLAASPTDGLRSLLGGPMVLGRSAQGAPAALYPADACLGVPGLPQSATGQTALFTGINASGLLGRHVSGFPTLRLKQLLAEHGIYRTLIERGFTVDYSNAYTPGYFAEVDAGRWKHSVTTVAAMAAGLELHPLEDIARGRAIYQDLTGQILRDKGFDAPDLTPRQAGRTISHISAGFDLTVFEYFQTDVAGHFGDFDRAVQTVTALDEFIAGVCDSLPATRTLVLCSDHGNIEDMSLTTHTTNPVPVIIYPGRPLRRPVSAITDVAPLVLSILEGES